MSLVSQLYGYLPNNPFAKKTVELQPETALYPAPRVKPRVLLLSCKGGHGHQSAANAISLIFNDRYIIEITYPLDRLRVGRFFSGVGLYNYLLSKNYLKLISVMTNISTPVLRRIARWYLIKPLERTVQKIKPDLIISITPFVNEIAVIVAQRNKIPFFLVTVDNDLKNWIFKKQKISYPIIIGHYLSTSAGRLLEKNIHPDDIHVSGFPLRRDFKEIKPTCEEMREKLKLPKQKDIILILMGGAGSTQSEKYAKLLVKSSLKVHVVVICGNNFKQFRYLQALSNPDITPLPFVHNISDYMSVSRLLITKPGPGSIEEAIAMKLLMILDTESILSWEKANVDMVLSYGIGVELRNSRNLVHLVEHVLNNQEQMKRCFYSIKQNSFDETISETAKELLCSKAS